MEDFSLLTRNECAEFLRISTALLDRLVKAGKMPVLKIGGRHLFEREEVMKAIRAGMSWKEQE